MLAQQGTVERCNPDGDRCINRVLVNILTKGQGGAIVPMEDTNLQEPKKIETVTNNVWFLRFSERCSDSTSQIAKN